MLGGVRHQLRNRILLEPRIETSDLTKQMNGKILHVDPNSREGIISGGDVS